MSMRVKEVVGSQWNKARKEVFESNINKFSLLLVDANMPVRTYVTYRILLWCVLHISNNTRAKLLIGTVSTYAKLSGFHCEL